jgi:arylformamidase
MFSAFVIFPVEATAQSDTDGDAEAAGPSSSRPFHRVVAPDFSDVAYGPHERQVLDFWRAPGAGPRPLLVWIHGGGWLKGGKDGVTRDLRDFLREGVSVAIINYRLIDEHTTLPAPVHDAARAVQFLRSKASEWNIDKNRLAAMGGSAGACSSMWLLFRDDLADPEAGDPVLRESTRLLAVAAEQGQTLIDPKLLEPVLGRPGVTHPMLHLSVGAPSLEAALANHEKYARLYHEFSPLHHVSPGDPPLFMDYPRSPELPAHGPGHGIHHPVFGLMMKEACDRAGVECHLRIEGRPHGAAEGRAPSNAFEFLLDKLLAR